MARASWWLVLMLCGCEPGLCWRDGDAEPTACSDVLDGQEPEEGEHGRGWEATPEDFDGDERGIDEPIPDGDWPSEREQTSPGGEWLTETEQERAGAEWISETEQEPVANGRPAPSADELRVAEQESPARVPYELGDVDVSELAACAPRPSCVEPMLRATSPHAAFLVFDGRTLSGVLGSDQPVLIADLPRRRLLELPATARVSVNGLAITFCTSSCQLIDLARGEIVVRGDQLRLSETPPATSPAPTG